MRIAGIVAVGAAGLVAAAAVGERTWLIGVAALTAAALAAAALSANLRLWRAAPSIAAARDAAVLNATMMAAVYA